MRWFLLFVFSVMSTAAIAHLATREDPVVRTGSVAVPDWPSDAPPMRIVLLSDLHAIAPETPPARVARIVTQVNALKPDLVLIAGDFVGDRELLARPVPLRRGLAPLSELRARWGGRGGAWQPRPPTRH